MVDVFMEEAINQAKIGLSEGGIPIGSVLVIDGKIVGKGHNKRIQKKSPTLHAEMDCLKNAGRLSPEQYQKATLYTTLSTCNMCSGAILLYKIPRVIIGENKTFLGNEEYLQSRGVQLQVLNIPELINMMTDFISSNPTLWNEDIGVKA